MEINGTHYIHGVQGLQGPHRSAAANAATSATTQRGSIQDETSFSEEALRLSDVRGSESSSSGVRFELVNRIKAEIVAGTYDTADKMDIALERLIGRMNPR